MVRRSTDGRDPAQYSFPLARKAWSCDCDLMRIITVGTVGLRTKSLSVRCDSFDRFPRAYREPLRSQQQNHRQNIKKRLEQSGSSLSDAPIQLSTDCPPAPSSNQPPLDLRDGSLVAKTSAVRLSQHQNGAARAAEMKSRRH